MSIGITLCVIRANHLGPDGIASGQRVLLCFVTQCHTSCYFVLYGLQGGSCAHLLEGTVTVTAAARSSFALSSLQQRIHCVLPPFAVGTHTAVTRTPVCGTAVQAHPCVTLQYKHNYKHTHVCKSSVMHPVANTSDCHGHCHENDYLNLGMAAAAAAAGPSLVASIGLSKPNSE